MEDLDTIQQDTQCAKDSVWSGKQKDAAEAAQKSKQYKSAVKTAESMNDCMNQVSNAYADAVLAVTPDFEALLEAALPEGDLETAIKERK